MRVVILFASVLLFLGPTAFGQELPSLKEIRAHLEMQLLTLDPIAVEFTVVSERPPGLPNHLPWADQPHRWTWTKDGSRERLVMKERFYEKLGSYVNHDDSVENGILTRLIFATKESNKVSHVTRSDRVVEFGDSLSPVHFIGLRLRSTEANLLDLLRSSSVILEGWAEIEGEQCVKLVADPVKNTAGTDVRWEFFLSPRYRFLPRKILQKFIVNRPKVPSDPKSELHKVPMEVDRTVRSFQRLSTDGPGQDYFFPLEAIEVHEKFRTTLSVTNVVYEAKVTEPMVPPGVIVDTVRDGNPVKRELSGSNAILDTRKTILHESPPIPPRGRMVDARPRESVLARWGVWAVSACLLISAITIWWRTS